MPSFSETSSQGWFGRIGGAIKGILFGFVATAGSVALLFWNEGRAVQTAKSLDEGAGAVVSVAADSVEPGNKDKLIHITGEATTDEVLEDDEFKISETAIRLERNVEMYQWEEEEESEERKKVGGGTETTTTYTYSEVWSDDLIDSSSFNSNYGADYQNPDAMGVPQKLFSATKVTVGAYSLSDTLKRKIENPSELTVTEENIPPALADRMTVQDQQTLYLGKDPSAPEIGDCRVSFVVTKPAAVSVIAQQTGETFQPYQTQAGDAINMLRMGTLSAEQMFKMAQDENAMLTWILRGVGAFVMFIGLMMIAKPISVVADVLPILGNIAETGLSIVAGLITIALSCLTIGVAWLFYRPLIGIPLVIVAVGAIVLLIRSRKTGPAPAEEPQDFSDQL